MIDLSEKSLDRMRETMRRLDNSQERLRVIHVAGTSGKGSTAYLTSEILRAHGFRVGLYCSPHLFDVRERVQIDGEWIDADTFDNLSREILAVEPALTYFELGTAIAYTHFAREQVDYAVIETGIGGLLDATNVIEREDKLCVLTRIGLDHTEFLGETIPLIAAQKAGIMQPKNEVVAISQSEEVESVFLDRAKSVDAHIEFVETDPEILCGLIGAHQKENASLAAATALALSRRDGWRLDPDLVSMSLSNAQLSGRFEIRHVNGKTLVLDGAHNPQKMRAFVAALQEHFPNRNFHFLVAFKQGKDVAGMLEVIRPAAASITKTVFTPQQQDTLNEAHPFVDAIPLPEALSTFLNEKPADDIFVATGSLYFLADLFRYL